MLRLECASESPGGHVATQGPGPSLFFVLFLFLMFIFERESVQEGWEKERGGQRIQSRLCTDSREPNAGLKLMNHEIMT